MRTAASSIAMILAGTGVALAQPAPSPSPSPSDAAGAARPAETPATPAEAPRPPEMSRVKGVPNLFAGTRFAAPDAKLRPDRFGAPGQPDLSGIWAPLSGGIQRFDFTKTKVPLTPAYAAKLKAYRQLLDDGRPPADPVTDCIASPVPRFMTASFEVLQTPGKVTLLLTGTWNSRHIYLNVPHDPTRARGYTGDSTAHWDGDTLVVETVNMPAGIVEGYGVPYSDNLRVTERLRRVEPTLLEVQFTLDDAVAFTHPWVFTWQYRLLPPGTRPEEGFCANNRNGSNGSGEQGTR